MKPIKVAMIGVGNCASSLVQGVAYYRQNNSSQGLIHDKIGGYGAGDVDFVLGIDVDARKVGKDISEAIFAAPNNTKVFMPNVPATGAKVIMGQVSDGVAPHMTTVGEKGFIVADQPEADKARIVQAIKDSGAEVLINFLPVGSQAATEFYMNCALEAGVAVVNCMPVFIASNPEWEAKFRAKNIPIVGDDIKAQVGATIVHRVLSSLFAARGVTGQSVPDHVDADMAFHRAVIAAAHNDVLIQLFDAFLPRLRLAMIGMLKIRPVKSEPCDHDLHQQLADAVIARNPIAAATASRTHLSTLKESFT